MSSALASPFQELERELGPGILLRSEAELAVYSYDAALDRGRPDAVVVPRGVEQVQKTIAWCARRKVPFVARGAGTNLSGGCIPLRGGIIIALARLDRILEIDLERGWAVVEPGVVNLDLQRELEKAGYFYAPDPASLKVSTIGGNIAENAGGPRCFKYGVTTNHVIAVEAVMPDGALSRFSIEDPGPELASLLVGAEGTLGVVVKAWLKILPLPREIRTILGGFPSIEAATECVAAIVAEGVVPRVLEALDRTTVESVAAYSGADYPKTEAVLLIETDGDQAGPEQEKVEAACRAHGALELRAASDPAERERLWEGRRGAYAAMARLAPNVMVEDGVVPRDKLPEIVRRIRAICAKHSIETAGLLFHAGDGNIHPNIAYDERNAEQTARVKRASYEILQACVELGGSLSGEHGIGVDKRDAMASLFSAQTLELFRRVKRALDPDELANPDKLFPLPGASKGPAYSRPPRPAPSAQASRLIAQVRGCAARGEPMLIRGSGSRLSRPPQGETVLEAAGLRQLLELDAKNLTVTVEAGLSVREFRYELERRGFFARLPEAGGTLGGLFATKHWLGLREDLLGMSVLLSDGSVCELGGKVVKNVAGYDLPRLLLGSWGGYALILELTLKLHARELPKARLEAPPAPFSVNDWSRRLKTAFDPQNLFNPWLYEGN